MAHIKRNFAISAICILVDKSTRTLNFGIENQSFYPSIQGLKLRIEDEILKRKCDEIVIMSVTELSEKDYNSYFSLISINK